MENTDRSKKKLLLFAPNSNIISETFIKSHISNLPFMVIPYFGIRWKISDKDGRKIFRIAWLLGSILERISPKVSNFLFNFSLALHLKLSKIDIVLAEYGTTGAWLNIACKISKKPLFIIFHGFDASVYEVLKTHENEYKKLFKDASGIIAVSKIMREKLIALGAHPNRTLWTPCGVDPSKFNNIIKLKTKKTFIANGRFVEKKAPYLTILAFNKLLYDEPQSKLIFIGNGPLFGPCKRLIQSLGIEDKVDLLGFQEHESVITHLQRSIAFIQHSLTAENGDSEGTPVAIIEAQMAGLPVISTRHAGIPDIVVDGETGFLVEEGDITGMATAMLKIARDSNLASKMGESGRQRALHYFTLNHHINALSNMFDPR